MSDDKKPKKSNDPRTRHHGLDELGREEIARRKGKHTRRRFLGWTALSTAGLIAAPQILAAKQDEDEANRQKDAKVVRTYHDNATNGWTGVNQDAAETMVHVAIRELTGIANLSAAWKSLFPGITATSKVGIKINLACGDVPTRPEIVNAVINGLLMMDLDGGSLPPEHIIVWDIDNPFFCAQTGYAPNWGGPGVQYVGSDHYAVGHDSSRPVTISHPGNTTSTHQPSRIITEHCDYLINAAVIKDHNDSGVTLCMKNTYGSFNGIGVYQMHTSGSYGDGHSRGEPELNRALRDDLGDKTKLYLIDGTYGLYNGGPGYTPPYHTPPNWRYNSVLVSRDIVAIDRIGTEKINEERANHSLPALDPSMISAGASAPYNLGVDKLDQIDLVELDVTGLTPVEETIGLTPGVVLLAPYPNPAPSSSTMSFSTPHSADVDLKIIDVRGRLVKHITTGRYDSGVHQFLWNGKDEQGRSLASGVYFCRLKTGGKVQQQRVTLVR